MGKVFIDESTLKNIGDAIRFKTGESDLINPLNMPQAILSISNNSTSSDISVGLIEKSIVELEIPEGTTLISHHCFLACGNLEFVTIPNSVISIDQSAFEMCDVLQCVVFDENSQLTTIGDRAFYECTSLYDFTLPDCVTNIGVDAFVCCNIAEVIFPDSITSIDDRAFLGCESLENIIMSDNISYIGEEAFLYTPYYDNEDNWIDGGLYVGNCLIDIDKNITECIVKDGTTVIAKGVFARNDLLQNIIIPYGITSIPEDMFALCESLISITIPNSVTSIDEWSFYFCRLLKSITIPDSVVNIGDSAFYGCGLTEVTILSNTINISKSAFNNCNNLTTINVPWSEGAVANAPWGAKNATINYNYHGG